MIRNLPLGFLLLFGLPAAAQTASEQKPSAEQKPAAPVCIYNSKTYSDGATVCVQKAMMQTCTSDGTKAIWTMVTDEKLSGRCVAPVPRLSKYQRRALWNRRNVAKEITAGTDRSPFCFDTNGQRFCE